VRWAADPAGGRPARVFHYGWVRTGRDLEDKLRAVEALWWGTLSEQERVLRRQDKFGRFEERYPILKKYRGTHPAVMAERVREGHDAGRQRDPTRRSVCCQGVP
jgi:hypothetical protein